MNKQKAKRLLLLAYFYPPLGGPAVQRPCKTVKYLTKLGWTVDVITVKGIVYHSTDESLVSECTHDKLIRTHSLDPMYVLNCLKRFLKINTSKLYLKTNSIRKSRLKKLFPIDDKIGWIPFAVRAGINLLRTAPYSAVMVTCGPFSSALAGKYLAKIAKLPFVIDYRDLWTLNNVNPQPQGAMFTWIQSLERKCLSAAGLVVSAGDMLSQMQTDKFGEFLKAKLLTVYNGWDEADFEEIKPSPSSNKKITIAYTGTLFGDRPIAYFLKALSNIRIDNPEQDFELLMVGNFYPETHEEIAQSDVTDKVRIIPQQSHSDAIRIMLQADILLLVIGKAKYDWVVTGKLFEYIRCQKPIMALASPTSEAVHILSQCGQETVCEIDDTFSIQNKLTELFTNVHSRDSNFTIPIHYERSAQVSKLDAALTDLFKVP